MSKTSLKQAKAAEMGIELEDASLIDTHRHVPKAQGGKYEGDNYTILEPQTHMRFHGNYREREEFFENLKAMVDDRRQVMNLFNKANNQLGAYKRKTDHLTPQTVEWLQEQSDSLKKELGKRTRAVEKAVKDYAKYDSLAGAAMEVSGIGANTVAYCLVYIDLEKARHASSLWSYVGLDKSSHARYQKGESSGGNKTLRTQLYTMAESNMKTRGAYREVYDRTKSRLSKSEKITKSRNTKGELIECKWCETMASHRHGAALRQVMKHFLADYWKVGRELMGLPTDPLYAESVLGGNHRTVQPEERGWKY